MTIGLYVGAFAIVSVFLAQQAVPDAARVQSGAGGASAPRDLVRVGQMEGGVATVDHRALEKTYRALRTASASGSEAALRRVISARTYKEAKDHLARTGRRFTPDMVRAFAVDYPDLTDMRLLEAKRAGDAAFVVFVGDEEKDPDGDDQILFVYIRFVLENGRWKFDGLIDIDDSKRQPDGTETRFKIEDVPPELRL